MAPNERYSLKTTRKLCVQTILSRCIWPSTHTTRARPGPMESVDGAREYLQTQSTWAQNYGERLDKFEVMEVQVYQLQPGVVQVKWGCKFIAPLPPNARSRGLPADLKILPGEKVEVQTSVRSELLLSEDGLIVSHRDEIVDEYDIPSTISRYEFLTARRINDTPPVWYWKVLAATTKEETSVLSGGAMSEDELQRSFQDMIIRNLALGGLIGVAIYAVLKFLKLYALQSSMGGFS
ncbi:hypothetical protein CYMTET_16040 [Cymbomonas tetramitiformis]|uniref:Uncharacterized protein n=1 Tax=Cymbomonas tetramitiformis TaxID=36881 RepID=A0AAE0GD49_9CHLO|nr:hypothetical protein CYMTET_16040 [Cymbomonas tetramitiformis]